MRTPRIRAALAAGAAAGTAALAFSGPGNLAAYATAAGSTTAPTATATPKPTPRVQPVVVPWVSAASVRYGMTATVTFTVTVSARPFAAADVRLGTALPGRPFTYTDAVTDDAGTVSLTQQAMSTIKAKVIVPGTDTTLEVTSQTATIAVATEALLSSPAKGILQVILFGAAGQTVQVERQDGTRWRSATTFVAKRALATVTGLTPGARYRIVVPTTVALTGLISAPTTIA